MGERSCSVDDCERRRVGQGYCSVHYQRLRRHGSLDLPPRVSMARPTGREKPCAIVGCVGTAGVPGTARGWCSSHYQRWQRHGDPLVDIGPVVGVTPCVIEGCRDAVRARSWCTNHYSRWQRYGDAEWRAPGEVRGDRRICPECGVDKPLSEWSAGQGYCKRCMANRAAAYRIRNPRTKAVGTQATCEQCGRSFMADKRRSRYCSPGCSETVYGRRSAIRRERVRAATKEKFDRLEVFERDNWICQLCLSPVDRSASWPNPRYPTLDHIVPIVHNGEHSRANTQTACLDCNVRKGARLTA